MKQRCCNYCGQTLPEIRLGVRLPALKARIFDLVQRGGEDGITAKDLFDILFGAEQEPPQRATIKSHINQINEALEDSGYRILGCGAYRLVKQEI